MISENKGFITVYGVDVFVYEKAEELGKYNLIIFDCGNIQENKGMIDKLNEIDELYLCCGAGWNELHHTVNAHKLLVSMRYTIVVMSGDEEDCKAHENEVGGNFNEYCVFNGDFERFFNYNLNN